MRLAYVVSRFPTDAETFVLRELNEVASLPDMDVGLLSLFPPKQPMVHPSAVRWTRQPHRPRPLAALRDLAWWVLRRPARAAGIVAAIVAGHARHPCKLARALTTLPLAASHARRVRSRSVEHLHAHFATYPALAAWVVHRFTDCPYSFTTHAHDLFIPSERCFLGRKYRDAEFVVAISEFNRRFLERIAEQGVDTPVHVIHCGVDPAAYPFKPRRPPASGPVRAICVASLDEHKGHSVLFEAMANAPPLERLMLNLVGGRDRRPLEQLARQLGISSRVRFHGQLAENEVAAMLAGADLFVLPSRVAADGQMEGIPVALIEALASGLCVVATRLSGVPELVEDGVTGILAEPGDPASLREALERALRGCGDASARRGRDLVERQFNVHTTAGELAALFRGSRGEAPNAERLRT